MISTDIVSQSTCHLCNIVTPLNILLVQYNKTVVAVSAYESDHPLEHIHQFRLYHMQQENHWRGSDRDDTNISSVYCYVRHCQCQYERRG